MKKYFVLIAYTLNTNFVSSSNFDDEVQRRMLNSRAKYSDAKIQERIDRDRQRFAKLQDRAVNAKSLTARESAELVEFYMSTHVPNESIQAKQSAEIFNAMGESVDGINMTTMLNRGNLSSVRNLVRNRHYNLLQEEPEANYYFNVGEPSDRLAILISEFPDVLVETINARIDNQEDEELLDSVARRLIDPIIREVFYEPDAAAEEIQRLLISRYSRLGVDDRFLARLQSVAREHDIDISIPEPKAKAAPKDPKVAKVAKNAKRN